MTNKKLKLVNGPIIYILLHKRLIIKVLFFDNFRQYLIEIKNKIKQLLVRLINKFKRFFEKVSKIIAAAIISKLLKLILNNLSINLT